MKKKNALQDIVYYKDDGIQIHRENGPAIIWKDGSTFWYLNDQCHRIDGPAAEYSNGVKLWFIHGEEIDCKTNEEFLRLMKMKAFW